MEWRDNMKILLILIMIMAAFMILTYFIAAITCKHKMLIAFRVTMLILILLLLITWITSMVLKQPFHILLGLAILFITLYIFS